MDAFLFLFLIAAILGTLVFGIHAISNAEQSRRPRAASPRPRQTISTRLSRVANHLPNGRRLRTGHSQVVEGRLLGRRVRIESHRGNLLYTLSAPRIRAPELTFVAAAGAFELEYDSSEEATKFAARLLRDPQAKHALSTLTQDQGLEDVMVQEGEVTAFGPGGRLTPSSAKRVFRDLHHLALAAEGLATRLPQRPVATSGKAIDWTTRTCPYCRDHLGQDARVACEQCDTVHHRECFEELGRCTTAACVGTRGFPVTQTHERAKVVIGAAPCNHCGLRAQGCRPGACQSGRAEQALHGFRAGRRTRRVGS